MHKSTRAGKRPIVLRIHGPSTGPEDGMLLKLPMNLATVHAFTSS